MRVHSGAHAALVAELACSSQFALLHVSEAKRLACTL